MDIELVTTRSRWREIESEWNGLLERIRNPQVFYTSEWLGAVWDHFGGANRLFLLVCRKAGRLIGIAPFCIIMEGRFGLKSRIVRFIGQPYSDFSDLLLEGEGREGFRVIAEFLRDHRRAWDRVHLREIPSTSATLVGLPAVLTEIPGFAKVENEQDSECFMVPIRADWDTYLPCNVPLEETIRASCGHRAWRDAVSHRQGSGAGARVVRAVCAPGAGKSAGQRSGRNFSRAAKGRLFPPGLLRPGAAGVAAYWVA